MGAKPTGKISMFTFREFLKHAKVFLGLIASSLKMFKMRKDI